MEQFIMYFLTPKMAFNNWDETYDGIINVIAYSHIEKGETMLYYWKSHTGTAGLDPGTHAWLARQSNALAIAPRPLLCRLNASWSSPL